MLNNQGQQEKNLNIIGNDKEKKVPKLIIRKIKGSWNNTLNSNNLTGIANSEKRGKCEHKSVKNKCKVSVPAKVKSEGSIADNVKLRRDRRSCTSNATVLSPISLPLIEPQVNKVKPCKRKSDASSFSVSSFPSASLLLVETMDKLKANNKINIPSTTSDSMATEIASVHLNDLQNPFWNSEIFSCDHLPSKKTKVLEHYPLIDDKEPSATSIPFDINELEVASYVEVSTFEPLQVSCELSPSEFCGVNDVTAEVNASSNCKRISPILTKEEKPVSNTERSNHIHSEISSKLGAADSSTFMQDHSYLSTINENVVKNIGVSQKELKTLDFPVEEFFSHSKELLVAEKKTDDHVSAIVDLVLQMEKQASFQAISSKVNGVTNKDHFAPSTFRHSSQARQYIDKIVTDYKNQQNSENWKSLNKLSSSSTGHALNDRNRNVISRQEIHATKEKEKRKAVDERCIVYVGNIPNNYSESDLRRRFQKFGSIKNIQIKSRVRCDLNNFNGYSFGSQAIRNFGFITFSCNQEATAAIEEGNAGHRLKFHLSFGARRQFVGEEYRDLDGIVAKNENYTYQCNSRSSVLCQKKTDEDFDMILKNYLKDTGVKPQPFRMKCRA